MAADSRNVGLIALRRLGSHTPTHYFINGRHKLTLLPFPTPLPLYFSASPTAAERQAQRAVLERALARYANELPDTLKQRIRQSFPFQ
ncbi:hypothetical protein LJ737_08700 [Hymenobacter sp. 15J16-1T3B]|uniref:hypothetical protein n=1 Tax=Hymenobacter sp. 15J16-1T3B TaxID=2886941 RepID=UPI001D10F370|nr:hypothetical protein [Hymenobacter sp. 15J16-1T3B]MCC3157316.1 hypothetical protein [Hymenobacter sp. 15J16-1T3B]